MSAAAITALSLVPAADAASARSPAAVCAPGHVVIQIHGTASTGEFKPNGVRPDAANPGQWLSSATQNTEFVETLLAGTSCRRLTFSYDKIYLAPPGVTSKPGVNAWNEPTSPWNTSTDVLADRLQDLMTSDLQLNPGAKYDLIGYSAGGIVPSYWATHATTQQKAAVHSIIVVDGIVSGVDLFIVDLFCALPSSIRNIQIATFGRLPCHFRRSHVFTQTIRSTGWGNGVSTATLRAKGDRIVWYEWAGLPGSQPDPQRDPDLVAHGCSWPWEWLFDFLGCATKSHGSVLTDAHAKTSVDWVLDR